jgi:hypothetical protein
LLDLALQPALLGLEFRDRDVIRRNHPFSPSTIP